MNWEDVSRKATAIDKPKSPEVLAALEVLAEAPDGADRDRALATVAAAHVPRPKRTAPKDSVAWIALAAIKPKKGLCSDEELYSYLYSTGKVLVATDRYRAHWTSTGLPRGVYNHDGTPASTAFTDDFIEATIEKLKGLIERCHTQWQAQMPKVMNQFNLPVRAAGSLVVSILDSGCAVQTQFLHDAVGKAPIANYVDVDEYNISIAGFTDRDGYRGNWMIVGVRL